MATSFHFWNKFHTGKFLLYHPTLQKLPSPSSSIMMEYSLTISSIYKLAKNFLHRVYSLSSIAQPLWSFILTCLHGESNNIYVSYCNVINKRHLWFYVMSAYHLSQSAHLFFLILALHCPLVFFLIVMLQAHSRHFVSGKILTFYKLCSLLYKLYMLHKHTHKKFLSVRHLVISDVIHGSPQWCLSFTGILSKFARMNYSLYHSPRNNWLPLDRFLTVDLYVNAALCADDIDTPICYVSWTNNFLLFELACAFTFC